MKIGTVILFTLFSFMSAYSQGGQLSGNFKTDGQYYFDDKAIDAEKPEEVFANNSFLNLRYTQGNLEFGMRYEAYLPPLEGFLKEYEGSGIANRYISYRDDKLDLTVGNFYAQFGSGLALRAYREQDLGIDNSIDGIMFNYRPFNGLQITGIYGNQRDFWRLGDGILRAGDIDLQLNSLSEELFGSSIFGEDIQYSLGTSFVSKYEKDLTGKLPENIMSFSSRFGISGDNFLVDGEWVQKINDPSYLNSNSYNEGYGYILNTSFFGDGWGLSLGYHKVDNMDFRSERGASQTSLTVNFLPPMTKYHTYALAGIFPFASQLNGEVGFQGEFTYKIPKSSFLGGLYGTDLTIGFSRITDIDSTRKVLFNKNSDGVIDTVIDNNYYDSPYFAGGSDELFYQDFSIEASTKITKSWKTKLKYVFNLYNKDRIEGKVDKFGVVTNNLIVWENLFKLSKKHAIRIEAQILLADEEHKMKLDSIGTKIVDGKETTLYEEPLETSNGDWLFLLAEYTIAPSLYITVFDQWNYGNAYEKSKLHYVTTSLAYTWESSRISLSYGRVRGGILCSGGICRPVPSSNGFSLSLSSSF